MATKGGSIRPGGAWQRDTSPEHIAAAIAGSHAALGGRPIQLWQIHNLSGEGRETLEETLEPVNAAIAAGVIEHVGLSNCTVEHIVRAEAALPAGALISVQNAYSMWVRQPERDGTLEHCQRHGLAFLPYSALGGSGQRNGERSLANDALFPSIAAVAAARSVSREAVCLAWMLAKWPCLVHIASARRVEHLEDSLTAADVYARHASLTAAATG